MKRILKWLRNFFRPRPTYTARVVKYGVPDTEGEIFTPQAFDEVNFDHIGLSVEVGPMADFDIFVVPPIEAQFNIPADALDFDPETGIVQFRASLYVGPTPYDYTPTVEEWDFNESLDSEGDQE